MPRIKMWTPNGLASVLVPEYQVEQQRAKGFTTKDPNATVKAPKRGKPKTSKEDVEDGDISRK